jgi:hypothetical protein
MGEEFHEFRSFAKTAEIMKETSFAKHKNRKNEEKNLEVKIKNFTIFLLIYSCEDTC